MGYTGTFKVSKKDTPPVEVTRELPENLDDPLWDKIVSEKKDIHDLALQAWIVKAQAGARNRLEQGEAAVQAYINAYVYGARTGGFAAPTISADEAEAHGFTDEQLAFLAASGMQIGAGA